MLCTGRRKNYQSSSSYSTDKLVTKILCGTELKLNELKLTNDHFSRRSGSDAKPFKSHTGPAATSTATATAAAAVFISWSAGYPTPTTVHNAACADESSLPDAADVSIAVSTGWHQQATATAATPETAGCKDTATAAAATATATAARPTGHRRSG